VLTLVDCKGDGRSFPIDKATSKNILPIVKDNIAKETVIATDAAPYYGSLNKKFVGHETVNHTNEEWTRGDIHTNRAEGYFSVFKRGMKGVYQHCRERHLPRYLSEFDFRYNSRIALGINDEQCAEKAIRGVVGKRLTYKTARQVRHYAEKETRTI
jgi:ISXO2-like transposase domain